MKQTVEEPCYYDVRLCGKKKNNALWKCYNDKNILGILSKHRKKNRTFSNLFESTRRYILINE